MTNSVKELQSEISLLEEQKAKLIKEIDEYESKLKQLIELNIKGDITLQCGTQTQINPYFHLKLDPKLTIDYAAIYLIISSNPFTRPLNVGMSEIDCGNTRMFLPGESRAIQLWERRSRVYLD